jgi:hypothetical protein
MDFTVKQQIIRVKIEIHLVRPVLIQRLWIVLNAKEMLPTLITLTMGDAMLLVQADSLETT